MKQFIDIKLKIGPTSLTNRSNFREEALDAEKRLPFYGFTHAVGVIWDLRLRSLVITALDRLAGYLPEDVFANVFLSRTLKFGAVILKKVERHITSPKSRQFPELKTKEDMGDAHRTMVMLFLKTQIELFTTAKYDMPRACDYVRSIENEKEIPLEYHYQKFFNNKERPIEPSFVFIGERKHLKNKPLDGKTIMFLEKEFPKSTIICLRTAKNDAVGLSCDSSKFYKDGKMDTCEGNSTFYALIIEEIYRTLGTTETENHPWFKIEKEYGKAM